MDSLTEVHSKIRQAYNLAAQKYHELFHNEMNEKEFDRNLLDLFAERFKPGALICDAGCGPSAHIGRYLFDKGFNVSGVDISDKCIEIARSNNPQMHFERADMASMPFEDSSFDGVISYYSIIHTPKKDAGIFFREFNRILKPGGYILIAVKAGEKEGFISELLGIKTEIYFSLFTEEEISELLTQNGFSAEYIQRRNPYDFEISNERIFAVGKKTQNI